MKTTDEIMADLIMRKDEYNMKKKNDIKRYTKYAACFALVLAILGGTAFALRNNFNTAEPINEDDANPPQENTINKLEPIYTNDEPAVFGQETPKRTDSPTVIKNLFDKAYTLKDAYEEAELVVEVVITDWLGEDTKYHVSFYKALIRSAYKNTTEYSEKELIFMQSGDTKSVCDEQALYNVGDKMFICVSHTNDMYVQYLEELVQRDGPEIEYSKLFHVVGSGLTELSLIEINGIECAVRTNKYYNFDDIPSSFDKEEYNSLAESNFGITQNTTNSTQSNSEENHRSIVILTMDDVLSYLYSVENDTVEK